MDVEPRLADKSKEKIYNLLVTTTAKSLEASLIGLVIQKYDLQEKVFDLAVQKIESFLSSDDMNLSVVGFQLLFPLLQKKSSLLTQYT